MHAIVTKLYTTNKQNFFDAHDWFQKSSATSSMLSNNQLPTRSTTSYQVLRSLVSIFIAVITNIDYIIQTVMENGPPEHKK